MCGEQWHGPGVGVIPELARVARQQLTELGIRKGRRRARTTGSFAISQRRWRSFGKIPLDPAIDRAAFYTRMLGNDGNRRTFCNLGNRPKAPIKSGVVRLLKRLQQASRLRPTERRIARSGCVHPDTIGSARACRKTSGYLLSLLPRRTLTLTGKVLAALAFGGGLLMQTPAHATITDGQTITSAGVEWKVIDCGSNFFCGDYTLSAITGGIQ